jgi:hypothetical protein
LKLGQNEYAMRVRRFNTGRIQIQFLFQEGDPAAGNANAGYFKTNIGALPALATSVVRATGVDPATISGAIIEYIEGKITLVSIYQINDGATVNILKASAGSHVPVVLATNADFADATTAQIAAILDSLEKPRVSRNAWVEDNAVLGVVGAAQTRLDFFGGSISAGFDFTCSAEFPDYDPVGSGFDTFDSSSVDVDLIVVMPGSYEGDDLPVNFGTSPPAIPSALCNVGAADIASKRLGQVRYLGEGTFWDQVQRLIENDPDDVVYDFTAEPAQVQLSLP